jgi:hypothetical protein
MGMTGRLAIIVLVASAASAIAASRCPSTRPAKARFRTVAWVSTTCRTDANGTGGHQGLYVQRGDRAPVVISQETTEPAHHPVRDGLCRGFGQLRYGLNAVLGGYYPQLAVSPDGRHIVFELNDRFSNFAPDQLTDDVRGLYVARADGSDVVRLRPATSVARYVTLSDGSISFSSSIAFSPDGRYLVYRDLGPAADGTIDAQLWSLRLRDRRTTQLTRLARLPDGVTALEYAFVFADATTVGFYTLDNPLDSSQPRQRAYSVSVDGTRFRELSPVTLPNGQVIPVFGVAGRRPIVGGVFVDGTPENPMPPVDKPRELFVAFGGKKVLQLTRLNRVDVGNLGTVVSRDGQRAYFSASADPFGCNPTHNCQLFSIDTLGRHLRQLTELRDGTESEDGCFITPLRGCPVAAFAQDRATGSLILNSSCDPLGTNPAGEQIFAMRPNGSGLRQITQARGVVIDTPDVYEVELPGPVAYQ